MLVSSDSVLSCTRGWQEKVLIPAVGGGEENGGHTEAVV